MPKSVEVPDFGVIEFPDEMDEAQIGSAIRQSVYKLPPLPEMAEYDQNTYRDRRFISENNLKTAAEDFNAKAIAFDKMASDIKSGAATTDEDTVSEAVKALKFAEARKQMATRDWEGVQKDPAPLGASFQASVAQGGLYTGAAAVDALTPNTDSSEVENAKQKLKMWQDAPNGSEKDRMVQQWQGYLDQALSTQAQNRPANQSREETRATMRQTAGELAGAASQAFQSADINPAAPNTAAQVGRGAGAVAALSPTFLLGGASLPAAVMQIGGETYERAYTQKEEELKAQGADESEIHSAAQDFATVETIKAAPAFAAYMVGGKLASGVVGRMLPEGSRALRGFAGAAAGTAANVATGGIIRKFEGKNFAPTVEQLTQDILFGIAHGVGEARRAPERPVEAEQIKSEETLPEAPAPTANETPLPAPESRPEAPQQARETTDSARDALAPAAEAGPRIEGAAEGVGRPVPEGEGITGAAEPVPAEAPRNLGPGAANIEEFGPQKTVAAYNDAVDKQRAERGLEPLMSEARKSSQTTWEQAEKKIEADPNFASELVNSIQDGKKSSVSDVEQDALLWRMIDLQNKKADAEIRAIDDKTYSPEERAEFAAQATELEGQLQRTEEANRKAGTSSARALNIRRQIANEDFTLAGMLRKGELSKGEKLTAPEIQKIQAQAEGIQGAEKAFQERTAKLEEETAGVGVDAAIKSIEAEAAKSPDFTPEVRSIADRIIDRLDRAAESAIRRLRGKFAQLGSAPDPTIIADLVIIGSAKVGKGFVKFGKWAAEMVRTFGDEVKPYLQDVWKQVDSSIDDVISRSTPDKAKRAKVKEAVAGTKTADAAEAISETLKERLKAGESIKDMRSMVQRLAENFVRGGVKGRDALVDRVHEVLKESDPGITRRQTMDLISGYGDFKALNKDAVKAEVRDIRGQLQQLAKLEDIESKLPLQKTGVERRAPSDEERRLIQQVNEAKKKFGVVVTDPETQLKSALDAIETRLENQIKDITSQIESGEKPRGRTPAPTNDRIDQLRALRDRVRGTLEDLRGKPELTIEQRTQIARRGLEAQISELERSIQRGGPAGIKRQRVSTPELEAMRARRDALRAELDELRTVDDTVSEERKFDAAMKAADALEKRLATGDLSTRGKKQGPDSEIVAEAKERLAGLRQEMQERRKALKPKLSPEQIAIKALKTRLEKRNAELAELIAKGDFSPRPKKPPVDISKDPEAVKLKAQAEQLRSDFTKQKFQWERDNWSKGRRAWENTKSVADATANIATSWDLSALRQGIIAATRRPITAIKNIGTMLRSFASERVARESEAELATRPNAELYKKSGLALSPLDETSFTRAEENLGSQLAEKVPLVRGSNRAFKTFLNRMRADSFDAIIGMKDAPTPAEASAVANFVNIATGRGNFGKFEAAVPFLGRAYWSPRLLLSRIQFLVGQPLWGGTGWSRKVIAKEYGKYLAGMAALYTLASLMGASVGTDPRSPDFGKIRIGNTRIDPLGGMAQVMTLAGRLATGKTKNASGEVKKANFGDVLGSFNRSKLSPSIGTLWDIVSRKQYGGRPTTIGSVARNFFVPLSLRDLPDDVKKEGLEKALGIWLLNLFGISAKAY